MLSRFAFPLVLLAFAAAPTEAAGNRYQAELSRPASAERFVAGDLVWSCAGNSCAATQSTSRPGTDCAALADKVGALRGFAVAGRPLASDALEKCNARAH
ncbi:MAG TPA: hypothetical protein VFW19_16570 [Allosphingosinicella sp.]|nr:hypothetical protein [Allosphingosinicella sp.]